MKMGFGWSIAYTGFQLVGAAIAALLYKVVRPEEFGQPKAGIFQKLLAEFLGKLESPGLASFRSCWRSFLV
jgi:hypothetical protein